MTRMMRIVHNMLGLRPVDERAPWGSKSTSERIFGRHRTPEGSFPLLPTSKHRTEVTAWRYTPANDSTGGHQVERIPGRSPARSSCVLVTVRAA
jgi:hypothetical protein